MNFFQGDDIPTSKSRKADYISFLEDRGVEFDPDWTVPMLWDLVKAELEGDGPCVVDDIAAKSGIRIVRLPPYHPEVSLFFLIWICPFKNQSSVFAVKSDWTGVGIHQGADFWKKLLVFCPESQGHGQGGHWTHSSDSLATLCGAWSQAGVALCKSMCHILCYSVFLILIFISAWQSWASIRCWTSGWQWCASGGRDCPSFATKKGL